MLYILLVVFILIIVLLYILKNLESFYEQLGEANDWGGSPIPDIKPEDVVQCNKDLDSLNNNYIIYLNTRDKIIKNANKLRENQLKNLDLDSTERVNMYKSQIKDATITRDKTLAEYATEKNLYDQCVIKTSPLNAILDNLRECCNTSRTKADALGKKYNKCIEDGPQLKNEIINTQKKYNDLLNQINNLKAINNQLNANLNDCITKKTNYQQALNGCMR
jgi:chromosome segregation ATPase